MLFRSKTVFPAGSAVRKAVFSVHGKQNAEKQSSTFPLRAYALFLHPDSGLLQAAAKVDELSGMVRDILDTSKVQDLQEEEKQKLYAGGEIGAVLQEYAMQIADKKLEVTDSIPEDCMLFMSRNTFQKVWSNLIGNAVQYTEQGGQITIAADTDKIWIVASSCS